MNEKMLKRKMIRKKKAMMDIDITSLMDIMTILLVFLLKSYNPSDLFVDLTKDIELPASKVKELGENSIIIKVDKNLVSTIDGTKIKDDQHLQNVLNEKKAYYDKTYAKFKRKPASHIPLNLVVHKDLTYKSIKPILNMATISGFNSFKFIVKAKD